MRLLLDTHVFLWLISGETPKISKKAKKAYLAKDHELFFSAASFWEICIKLSLQKLELKANWLSLLNDEMAYNQVKWLEIKQNHCLHLVNLPFHHRDPFDRLLVAQAMDEEMSLLSSDEQLKKYPIEVIW